MLKRVLRETCVKESLPAPKSTKLYRVSGITNDLRLHLVLAVKSSSPFCDSVIFAKAVLCQFPIAQTW